MARVVVTGGAGFIGCHLVDALVARGDSVAVVDTFVDGRRHNRLNPEAVYHEVDVRDEKGLARTFADAETVFHLAALPRVQYSLEYPIHSTNVNVIGTATVLDVAQRLGVRRVVYSASSSAYGNSDVLPLQEDMPAKPMSPYAFQKHAGEILCATWYRSYALETVCLRYFNVYGPRLDLNGAYAQVLGVFLRQRQAGEPLTITGTGEQRRDMVHVTDVVRANLLAAESPRVGRGEVINIGAGENHRINELADLFGGKRIYIPPRLEPFASLANIEKAQDLLGWKPAVRFEDGICALLASNG